jgi:ParE toxin of type II toxin-antitoxin system, parDE
MRIRWTPAAADDLQRISDYLSDHHPHYRQETIRKIYSSIQALKQWRIAAAWDERKERENSCSNHFPMSRSIA